jgi:hypothetical protein
MCKKEAEKGMKRHLNLQIVNGAVYDTTGAIPELVQHGDARWARILMMLGVPMSVVTLPGYSIRYDAGSDTFVSSLEGLSMTYDEVVEMFAYTDWVIARGDK